MKPVLLSACIAATVALSGCNKDEQNNESSATASEATVAAAAATYESYEQKLGYAIGRNIGQTIANDQLKLDKAALFAGIADTLDGKDSALSDEEIAATFKKFQEDQMAAQQAAMENAQAKNAELVEAGLKYLEENKAKEGVVVTDSGLQYTVIAEGEGEMPGPDDEVTVHYVGTLVDGTEFDSSISRGEPISFPVNGVIPGWTEALQLMKVGSKYQLVIPSDLAYGPGGTGPIPPNAVLIFEVELLSVQKAG